MMTHPLKQLRIRRGLSQAALAREIEVDQTTVGRWERGETMPRRPHLIRLNEMLGGSLTLQDFLSRESASDFAQ